jgi:protein phosphatase
VGAVVNAMPLEQAVRFLVHLANLRGGPDNITVLIVQVPNGNGPGKSAAGAKGNPLAKLAAAWGRRVPWPFTLIGAGCVVAGLTLLMQQNGVPGAMLFFVLAALLIVPGVIGLIVHVQKEPPPDSIEPAPEAPRELHVYKKHDCTLSAELAERFAQIEATLLEGMRAQGVPLDEAAHARLVAAAEGAAEKGDAVGAFRARCESLLFLAEAFHKARHKQESFQPNWTPPPAHQS